MTYTIKLLCLLTFFAVLPSVGLADKRVPDLLGEHRDNVEQLLIDAGLTLGEMNERYSNKMIGTIIWVEPRSGTLVPNNSPVDVEVSIGLLAPDITGLPQSNAIDILNRYGLRFDVRDVSVKPTPAGIVHDQSPAPNVSFDATTTEFILFVSTGPGQVVPNVKGDALAIGLNALSTKKLVGKVISGSTSSGRYPFGCVQSGSNAGKCVSCAYYPEITFQDPTAQSPAWAGDTIELKTRQRQHQCIFDGICQDNMCVFRFTE